MAYFIDLSRPMLMVFENLGSKTNAELSVL